MTYRPTGERIDRIRGNEERVGEDCIGGSVEVWAAWFLQEVGIALNKICDSCVIQASMLIGPVTPGLAEHAGHQGQRGY